MIEMTLRQWYAGQALAGVLADGAVQFDSTATCVRTSFEIADMMLAFERLEESENEGTEIPAATGSLSEHPALHPG